MRAAGNTTVEYEDLLQEARLSFLTHIRGIDSEDKICSCSYALLRAMYKHCVEMAPIHIPLNRFRQEIKEVSVLPLDSLSDVESGDSFEDEVESRLMTENFWNSLSDTDRKILDSKMQGRKG